MGGRGSGGRRVGAGRKGKRAVVVRHPSAPANRDEESFPPTIAPEIADTAPSATPRVEPPAELQVSVAELATLMSQLAFLQEGQGPGEPNPQIAELQSRVDELQAQRRALAIWHELAPQAVEQRTLTPATTAAFVMLCRAVVKERALSASDNCGGADHRGLMHRVATWMKDFCLSPFGKPLSEAKPEKPAKSKWAGILR